jgi:hypothetical protein
MPLQQTSGNVTADAYGGGVAVVPNYIEDVFSTWLFNGGAFLDTVNVNNGFDMTTKKGLIISKTRSTTGGVSFVDTTRGQDYTIFSNTTGAQAYQTLSTVNAFQSTGFSWITGSGGDNPTVASWTFLKQPKFFDVVTWTGTGSATTIAHNLGSVPGCIIVKRTDAASNWPVYHRSLANTSYLKLNDYVTTVTGSSIWNSTTATSTVFSVGTDTMVNASGGTYVAYVYAHNAGGFGLTGTDNVVTCDTFTTDGSGIASINLGYEPQWLLVKDLGSGQYFQLADNMRGLGTSTSTQYSLFAGAAQAETASNVFTINATGFGITQYASRSYIYIAIRRGPMKVPTDGTKVFLPASYTGVTGGATVTTNFPVDMIINQRRNGATAHDVVDRLRGGDYYLSTYTTDAEASSSGLMNFQSNTSVKENDYGGNPANTSCSWMYRRAPSFFDEVCYTGTGSTGQVVNHNLAATPEMVIIKRRDGTFNWFVYQTGLSYGNSIYLNQNSAQSNDGGPAFALTSTTITFDRTYVSNLNTSGGTYVAYLFATCAGVSKVGSYTGNGSSQTINCGFTGGARFVLIKRTDSTGDWYVYDTARGMTTLTDPYLLLNDTAAESATLGSVTTVTTGFAVNASILAAINTNGASYIYLSIA